MLSLQVKHSFWPSLWILQGLERFSPAALLLFSPLTGCTQFLRGLCPMWVRLVRGTSAACPSQVHCDLAKQAHSAWAHGFRMQRRKAYVASGVSHSSL